MLNKYLLAEKYNVLIGAQDKESFIKDVNFMREVLNLKKLKKLPTLIYSKNKRNALYYTLCIHLSLIEDKILDYTVITGQSLINQHFLTDKNKDIQLHNNLHYTDITFISLSQYDYTSEYLESLIIDLVEFRNTQNKITIISYDVLDSPNNYTGLTHKLHNYFGVNNYNILDITKSTGEIVKPLNRKKVGRII